MLALVGVAAVVTACSEPAGLVMPPEPPTSTVAGQSMSSLPVLARMEDVGPCETTPPTPRQLRALRLTDTWQPSTSTAMASSAAFFVVPRVALRWTVVADEYFQAVEAVDIGRDDRVSIVCDGLPFESGFILASFPVEVSSLVLPVEGGFSAIDELKSFAQETWEGAGSPLRSNTTLIDMLLDPEGDGECPTCQT
jgi:hypothetical protein